MIGVLAAVSAGSPWPPCRSSVITAGFAGKALPWSGSWLWARSPYGSHRSIRPASTRDITLKARHVWSVVRRARAGGSSRSYGPTAMGDPAGGVTRCARWPCCRRPGPCSGGRGGIPPGGSSDDWSNSTIIINALRPLLAHVHSPVLMDDWKFPPTTSRTIWNCLLGQHLLLRLHPTRFQNEARRPTRYRAAVDNRVFSVIALDYGSNTYSVDHAVADAIHDSGHYSWVGTSPPPPIMDGPPTSCGNARPDRPPPNWNDIAPSALPPLRLFKTPLPKQRETHHTHPTCRPCGGP